MIQSLDLLRHVMERGKLKSDRTGTGTFSAFGAQAHYPRGAGFPPLTTKKVHTQSIIDEPLWVLRGETNVKYLNDNGVTIGDEWADADGNRGRVDGERWCDWRTVDGRSINQIKDVIAQIRKNSDSGRLIVRLWKQGEITTLALPRCHALFQFCVSESELSCQFYQRSATILPGAKYFSHIKKRFHEVFANVHRAFLVARTLIALSSPVKRVFTAKWSGSRDRRDRSTDESLFDMFSTFCYS